MIRPNQLQDTFDTYVYPERVPMRKTADSIDFVNEFDAGANVPVLQNFFRPAFGKEGVVTHVIGHHPDFIVLKDTDSVVHHEIVTLFLDMVGSTRLSLIYPLEDVYRIKNAVLRSAIDIATSFDGHVHRIMGDAIMVFFGGIGKRFEDCIVDALNAAASIQYFSKKAVIPWLKRNFEDDDFGIRIGIDYAPREKIIWSCYGYSGVNEVSATSFHVDIASKLQHAAGIHKIMIGNSLKSAIDFPIEFLKIKTKLVNGQEVAIPFVKPNHTDRTGCPINYRQHIFQWDKYLKYTPLAMIDSEYQDFPLLDCGMEICDFEGQTFGKRYFAASSFMPKNKFLKYKVNVPYSYNPTLTYEVVNHGIEAAGKPNFDNHSTKSVVDAVPGGTQKIHWETTAFRGFHIMSIKLCSGDTQTHEANLGIFVL